MRILQKAQVIQAVHRRDCARPVVGRRLDVEAQLARRLHQAVQPRRHLLRRAHLAARKIGLRMVKLLIVVKERLHAWDLWTGWLANHEFLSSGAALLMGDYPRRACPRPVRRSLRPAFPTTAA